MVERSRNFRHPFSDEFLTRYRIDDVIGTGGTAIVYRARGLDPPRDVALKVLDAIGFDEGDAEGRFEDEARLAARLEHANLCRLYEYGRDGDHRYLAYELVEGIDLARAIRRARKSARKGMALERALRILGDIARGLGFAHKLGVVHRDLKPANILLDAQDVAKVTDFGLAKMAGMTREIRTETGMVVGTPECMAPEQAMGREVGPPADIYALGCLLFWMLAGRPPFEGEAAGKVMLAHVRERFPDLRELRPNLGEGLYRLIETLTQRRPGDRPDAAGVLQALRLLERPGGSSEVASIERVLSSHRIQVAATPAGRGRLRWLAGGLGFGALALAGWWLWPRAAPAMGGFRLSPVAVRFDWVGTAGRVGLIRADRGDDRRWVAGEAVAGGGYAAEFGGLEPGTGYLWEFEGHGPASGGDLVTPTRARVDGPWPGFDEAGNPVTWLLTPPEEAPRDGVTKRLPAGLLREQPETFLVDAAGARAPVRADGLVALPPGGYGISYWTGLVEPRPRLGRLPNLPAAQADLVRDLENLSIRALVAEAVRAHRLSGLVAGDVRRASGDVYPRWRGLAPALRGRLARLTFLERLAMYKALEKAGAVDRALRNEGLSAVFDVGELQARCLSFRFGFRALRDPGDASQVLLTKEEFEAGGDRSFLPPRWEVDGGDGDIELRAVVADVWADRYLVFEVSGAAGAPLRIPVRPPLRARRFSGEIRLVLPAEAVEGPGTAVLHLVAEALPGVRGGRDRARYPLLEEGRPPRPDSPARLVSRQARRR